jgi:NAD(P)-dependent dehydrogenase (short-subunit alcohol dehydrogenase family)
MIAVMGASGHTGRRVAELLLDSGEKVRALGRSKEKLAPLEKKGRGFNGRCGGCSVSGERIPGADGLFTLLPPDSSSTDYRALQDGGGSDGRLRETASAASSFSAASAPTSPRARGRLRVSTLRRSASVA